MPTGPRALSPDGRFRRDNSRVSETPPGQFHHSRHSKVFRPCLTLDTDPYTPKGITTQSPSAALTRAPCQKFLQALSNTPYSTSGVLDEVAWDDIRYIQRGSSADTIARRKEAP